MRTLNPLEWSLIQNQLAGYAKSPVGYEKSIHHIPFENPSLSIVFYQKVKEARKIIDEKLKVFHFLMDNKNPETSFETVKKGGVLTAEELWIANHFIESTAFIGSEFKLIHNRDKNYSPLLAQDWKDAPALPSFCSEIRKSVSSEGQILDTASNELRTLRDRKASKKKEFETTLDNKIKQWSTSGFLQDSYFDIIDGRYVVPVKASEQSKIQGALHGKSNTGQSVFMEPTELTLSNNALKEIDLAIRAEEYRILKTLSQGLIPHSISFSPWIEKLPELDLIQSAATLSNDWSLNSSITLTTSFTELNFKELFHPALIRQRSIGKEIIKNDISLLGKQCLVISGPNTGGKTVLLKAIGLSALMAKAGLALPCQESSTIPLYKKILAFIGDDQSIAKGLSSFSSQIADLQSVLNETEKPCLILIDEILSSTDPDEASALAQAILEQLVEQGHHLIVTTHYADLAVRIKSNPKFRLAGMEFSNGAPTYRLKPDELGSSHAIEVAENLGLSKSIISRAKNLISTIKLDYLKAQKDLREKELKLEAEHQHAINELNLNSEKLKNKYETKISNLEKQVHHFLNELKTKADSEFNEWKKRVIQIQSYKKPDRPKADLQTILNALQTETKKLFSETEIKIDSQSPVFQSPIAGDRVLISSMGKVQGDVIEIKNTDGIDKALIQVGHFRVLKEFSDLQVIPQIEKRISKAFPSVQVDHARDKCDLRGLKFDEAMREAEIYMDSNFRNGISEVIIITGHGTGAIKNGFKELVKNLPYVKSIKPERQTDDGAWIIEFDR